MLKACAKCGKIHAFNYVCRVNQRAKIITDEAKQRSTYAWTEKSKEVREKANYLCEVCKLKGLYVYEGVEVHHITKLRENAAGLLDNANLVCLCRDCHEKADSGKLDKDLLLRLAQGREEK